MLQNISAGWWKSRHSWGSARWMFVKISRQKKQSVAKLANQNGGLWVDISQISDARGWDVGIKSASKSIRVHLSLKAGEQNKTVQRRMHEHCGPLAVSQNSFSAWSWPATQSENTFHHFALRCFDDAGTHDEWIRECEYDIGTKIQASSFPKRTIPGESKPRWPGHEATNYAQAEAEAPE